MALVVRADFHWLCGKRVNVKSLPPVSSRPPAPARHFNRHLRGNALRRLYSSAAVSADRIAIIPGELIMHVAGRMGGQILVLVNRATPNLRIVAPEFRKRCLEARLTTSLPTAP